MKSLLRLTEAVYNKPWLITPSMHSTIRKQLENHIMDNNLPTNNNNNDDGVEIDPSDLVPSKVAIIGVEGVIGKHLGMLETACGGVDVDCVADELREAVADNNVTDIVLYFNTPGGTVTGVPELAELISEVSKQKNCVAYVDVLCASAGYYLASQCSAIYCSPSSDLGSVGVYSIYLDESVMLANEGIKVNAISAGKYKLTGASFKPMTEEEQAMLQADVDKIYKQFKEAVLSKRVISEEDLQGQCFDGVACAEKGFVDGHINSLGELVAVLDN